MWNKPWCPTHSCLCPSVILNSVTRNFSNPSFIPACSEELPWTHVHKVLPSPPQHLITHPFSKITTTMKHRKPHLQIGESYVWWQRGDCYCPWYVPAMFWMFAVCWVSSPPVLQGCYCDVGDQWIALKCSHFELFLLYYYHFLPFGNWQEAARDLGKMQMRHVFKR